MGCGLVRARAGWSVPENRFVGEIARTYDQPGTGMFDGRILDATVDCLVELTNGGAALEFAIGTGRIAIPLTARGVSVTGIELSADMLEVLRSKPEADEITAIEGDMAVTQVEGAFSLVYLVFNTITNLTSQDEQVCVLRERGAAPPPWWPLCCGEQRARSPQFAAGQPRCAICTYGGLHRYRRLHRSHPQADLASRHFYRSDDGSFREFTAPFRYVWPAELDLMARIAGMTLEHRWAWWDRSPFTGESASHVSVWRLPEV